LCLQLEHVTTVNCAAFSPDGNRIVTDSRDNTAAVWDAATGRSIAQFRHEDAVIRASFTPDGRHVLTAS
jgi:WD40 repeat protein